MTFGFIGAGNMASAIIQGMTIKSNVYEGKDIQVYDISSHAVKQLAIDCGVVACHSPEDAVICDVLILAVKPNTLPIILPQLKEVIQKHRPLVISIAVSRTLSFLENLLGDNVPIVRVMPNINAKAAASTSGFCANANVTSKQKETVCRIFSTVGSVTEIDESQFSIFGVLAGSAPAFAYLYIDVLARAAQKAGMSKKQALELSAQTVLGSAKMVLESNEHPWSLVDQVCSPGGTTIEGIYTLEENGFESCLIKAFDAVLNKDKALQSK